MTYRIAVLPGDGIGAEIVPQALRVLEAVGAKYGLSFTFTEGLIGGIAIDETGQPLPQETLELCRNSDAILLGAIGGPKWDNLPTHLRPEVGALLPLRKALGLYANIRPCRTYDALADASTLKKEVLAGTDMVIIRELTGGLYFGSKGRTDVDGVQQAWDTMIYSTPEIERIVRLAFETARHRRKKLCSVDKANVLESSRLWRETVNRLAPEYPDIAVTHMYVDNAAMQLIRNPGQFDVVVTENTFGDILSDQASMLSASLGMLASASLGGRVGLYEPAHGSAPDIAGQKKANPIATILSAAMMLEYSFNRVAEARAIEAAIEAVLAKGFRTGDIMEAGKRLVNTEEMTDRVLEELA
ncbi:3-isopropylmalate dehydrogenase [Heliomicrobium modesticaldum Ice1]|uniref:3-isopropylmalate dehydrogenase n=1 Tax=Heliobacterium modesticaldum (strain ATCC 51547 / Ice1) TaxID=498761 RepID=B0TCR4_HELMI|nr:3-isopropylmalate dehydrogenase [Heliomicrobium modesticaldum]ABZ84090.1 3-isopropylmalate dehydrogenase [Heliomicrobium modesticaldum Ice1]